MNIKNIFFLLLITARCCASDAVHHNLKERGEQFKKRMETLAKDQCENIPRYRTDVLKSLTIKITPVQLGGLIEKAAHETAIGGLQENMRKELQKFFPQSSLINDAKARRDQAEYYFDPVYEQFKQQEHNKKMQQNAYTENKRRLASIIDASQKLNEQLRLQRLYARERQHNNIFSSLSCCMRVEIDE